MRIVIWFICVGLASNAQAEEICSDIDSDDARLRCYDEVAERSAAKELGPQSSAVDQDTPAPAADPSSVAHRDIAAAASTAPAATPKELFGRSAEDTSAIIADAAGVEEINKLEARAVSVTRDPYGRFVVLLDNQQRWRQVGSERFQIKAGDEIEIRRAALGSFWLQRRAGGRKTKVRRLE